MAVARRCALFVVCCSLCLTVVAASLLFLGCYVLVVVCLACLPPLFTMCSLFVVVRSLWFAAG